RFLRQPLFRAQLANLAADNVFAFPVPIDFHINTAFSSKDEVCMLILADLCGNIASKDEDLGCFFCGL
ncbi:MAG: hypothetical protein RSC86_00560, partial [Oscillospiraceae bacterium]